MRLKRLLEDANKEEAALQLNQKIESGNWIAEAPILYRGTSTEIDTWQVKPARKRRDPIDTDKDIHVLVDLIGEQYHSEIPLRDKTIFASTKVQTAQKYGSYRYIILPHKDAKIASLGSDSFIRFFKDAEYSLKTARRNLETAIDKMGSYDKFKENFETVIGKEAFSFLTSFRRDSNDIFPIKKVLQQLDSISDLSGYLQSTVDKVGKGSGVQKNVAAMYFSDFVSNLWEVFKYIKHYFEDIQPDIKKYSEEVLIDGKVIQINIKFFHEYFDVWTEEPIEKIKLEKEYQEKLL